VLREDQVNALFQSIIVPPSDFINADDFATAAAENPPSV